VRSFAPEEAAPGDLAAAFPDVVEAAAACAFSGCTHATERDCAVVDAIDAGRLSADRLARWRRLADDG
jgi:ribosome biogenesis GTPase